MWIARDYEENLYLFENKPIFYEYHWYDVDNIGFDLPNNLFKELTYETGPINVNDLDDNRREWLMDFLKHRFDGLKWFFNIFKDER